MANVTSPNTIGSAGRSRVGSAAASEIIDMPSGYRLPLPARRPADVAHARRPVFDASPAYGVGMRGQGVATTVAVLSVVAGCTSSDGSSPPARTTSASTPPDSGSTSPTETTTTQAADPERQPLVLAYSVRRRALSLSTQQARAVIAGRVTTWPELGQPGGRLDVTRRATLPPGRAVAADELVVVPGSGVTPLVQVAVVDGVDPMTEPSSYPLSVPATGPVPPVTRMTVVGDVMLGRRVVAATPQRPGAALTPMVQRLVSADLTVGNLESTLSDEGRPRQGDDSFAADPAALDALDAAGFDLLSLANNHSGDYGEHALRQTIARLDASPISQVGAGVDARDAWRPRVLTRHGVRFGFVAFNAIGETPRATPRRPGAAEIRMQPRTGPLSQTDLRRAVETVRRLNGRVDVVVVLPHWGEQYTNLPVPDQRVVGSALLDAGADIVVGGHPHWVQGVDVHDDRLIVNSLGNFVFDMDFSPQTQQGVTIDIVCWGDQVMSTRFTPYVIGPDFAPRPVHGPVARRILKRMWVASDPPFGR